VTAAPSLAVIELEPFERDVLYRLPFRFGAATVTRTTQAFVRVRIVDERGVAAEGVAAELMVPRWFDKSPDLSVDDNLAQLRTSLALARERALAAGRGTAFALHAAAEGPHHAACAARGLNGLIASFGMALIDRAVLDALCRSRGVGAVRAIRANLAGMDAATAPDLADFALDTFLATVPLPATLHARHTVGLADALTRADLAGTQRLDDGLPECLEDAIATYGHTHFKLKLSGEADADLDRLKRIAAVLDRLPGNYLVTLDGNEQFASAEAVLDLWRRMADEPRLARLVRAVAFIEQPIARARALEEPLGALAGAVPVEIDESDGTVDAFPAAAQLGYTGVSSKSCKGWYRALLNRARVERWNRERPEHRFFMSAEDLTTQAGVSVQQDLLLAAMVGATHVERNGHHYVDGMAGAPAAEQRAFAAAHPDLYATIGGRARLRIENGRISLRSIGAAPGLGSAVHPDWTAMRPMEMAT
jgi:L-alanine-DL-glutamate epimerase-like enolase superfamily enzyme